jgi:hypothetical protein
MVAQRVFVRRAARQHWARGLDGWLVCCIVAATVAHAADVPKFDEMPVDPPNLRGWIKARNSTQAGNPRQMLHGDVGWNQAEFDAFFGNILFPQFTLYKETDEAGHPGSNVLPMTEVPNNKLVKYRTSMLPTCREEFIRIFINQAERNTNQEPYNHLNQLTIQAMRTIALGNYHPLSRYNAALLLSSLHESQSEKPLKAALPALLACLDSTDLVQIAALEGLLKHAKAGSEGAQRPQLIAAMLKIVNQKTPPKGRSNDGHDWMRRRAIDVLAALGDAGPNFAVVAALDAILKDNQSSPDLSCSAAKALGSISFHAPDGMNAAATVSSIAQVAIDAYKTELARAEERRETALVEASNRGPSGSLGLGGPPPSSTTGLGAAGLGAAGLGTAGVGAAGAGAAGAGAAGATTDLFISVPLLRSQLYALDRGSKGLVAATSGTKDQQFAESVEKNLALLMASCDPAAANYDALRTQISKSGAGLEAALAAGAPGQGRAPAQDKGAGASKQDSFDSIPEKPAPAAGAAAPSAAVPLPVAPPAPRGTPGK